MSRFIERFVNNAAPEVLPIGILIELETLRKFYQIYFSPARNSIMDLLTYKGGDFASAYGISSFSDVLIRTCFKDVNPNLSRGVSVGLGVMGVLLAEMTHILPKSMSTPDLADIPAGLAGPALYLGISLLESRTQYKKAKQV